LAPSSSGGCLFAPFRLFGNSAKGWIVIGRATFVAMAFLLVGGICFLWRVPWLAKTNDVEDFDLLVRCLDTHQNQPFYLFDGYQQALKSIGIPFQQFTRVSKVESTRKGPNQYQHKVYDEEIPGSPDKPRTATVVSTTPHTMIPVEQLESSRKNIDKLFPDEKSKEQVLAWGQGLFSHWWWHYAKRVRRRPDNPIIIEPTQGTPDEHLWFAWQRLTNGGRIKAQQLFDMTEVAHRAYPREADLQSAMAWAKNWLAEREAYHQQYRVFLQANGEKKLTETPAMVVPPATESMLCWLLYQFVGLDPTSRKVAQERWLGFFARDKSAAVVAWGKKLEQERRQAGEPLPPADDNVALLCAVERLTGTDGYGQRCRRLVPQVLSPPAWFPDWKEPRRVLVEYIQLALTSTYPNDDLFYLAGGGDPFGLLAHEDDPTQRDDWFVKLLFLFILLPMVTIGLRDLLLIVLARWILRLGDNPHYQAYQEWQYRFDWRGAGIAYLITPLSLWGITWLTLKPPLTLLVPTPWHLLAGVYIALILGGTLVLSLNRLVAILLLRFGWDIHKTWLDEIIGTILAVLVLAYFGNDPAAIVASVVFALLPEVLSRHNARKRGTEERQLDDLADDD
jgi:hypothetical protein